MSTDHLRGPWVAILSSQGDIVADFSEVEPTETVDICLCRGSAIPKDGEWPRRFSGDDVIELWDDLEVDGGEAEIRWVQTQAMLAGLNAAGGAA